MVLDPSSFDRPDAGTRVHYTELPTPEHLHRELPLPPLVQESIFQHRRTIENLISGSDQRLLAIVGPCSIHDTEAALTYAGRLRALADRYRDKLVIVMRTYMEKPRTSHYWKGLVNDPFLDGSHDVVSGLRKAREFLLAINHLGLPCATEFLNPLTPLYFGDLIAWAAIGARTTTSQIHREMASWLPMPVGFKNSLDGDIQVAVDAMLAGTKSHTIMGSNPQGRAALLHSSGNPFVHLTLRGGRENPNYSADWIATVKNHLQGLPHSRLILVDCSHGNSNKHYKNQVEVLHNLLDQIKGGETAILGFMLESFLREGNQSLTPGQPLTPGVSITDSCVSWEDTEYLLEKAYTSL